MDEALKNEYKDLLDIRQEIIDKQGEIVDMKDELIGLYSIQLKHLRGVILRFAKEGTIPPKDILSSLGDD